MPPEERTPRRSSIRVATLIAISSTVLCLGAASDLFTEDFELPIPTGLPPKFDVPDDNPLTKMKISIGRRLFFDTILSQDGSTSCATCHVPEHGFAGDTALPTGIDDQIGRRNAPSLLNRAYGSHQFWDGRAATLEEQSLLPIENETELGSSLDAVMERLIADKRYKDAFETAFVDGVTPTNLAKALASYERTLMSGNSPVDRFMAADTKALSVAARRGKWLFESRGRCWRCHSGSNFTDEAFHNTGVGWGEEPLDLGRFEVTEIEADRGGFKTPTLRGVASTAPYMHDGSKTTLRDAVEFYRMEGERNPHLDPILQTLELSEQDVADLVAFLEALSGDIEGDLLRPEPSR